MSEAWFANRLTFYQLLHRHPEWSNRQFAEHLQRSLTWVKKWKQRIGTPPSPDPSICHSRSCARHTPPPPFSAPVVARILELRDSPPPQLHRIPGADTILWYLHQDPTLAHERLPQSPTTIWKLLVQHQRIQRAAPQQRRRIERPAPLEELELDFTDVPTIPIDPEGKRAHAAEAFNWVDRGTSIPVATQVSATFHAASTIATCAAIVQDLGLPERIRCDRDPRFVGSTATDDFPAPFMRFWMNLGVEVVVCPPHRPDLKPFVERFNRTYKEECLRPAHPTTPEEAQRVSDAFRAWFCAERPHQGAACGNQPPFVAFPTLPTLRAIPAVVDPDGWVAAIDGCAYVRTVDVNGGISLDAQHYYVGRALAKQSVTIQVAAPTREFIVFHAEQEVKRLPIKNLMGTLLPFAAMVAQLCQAADREEQRLRSRQRRPRRRPQPWSR